MSKKRFGLLRDPVVLLCSLVSSVVGFPRPFLKLWLSDCPVWSSYITETINNYGISITAERVGMHFIEDNYVLQRSLKAYHEAQKIISGNVLEIGCGNGYGLAMLSDQARHLTVLDKKRSGQD